MKTNNTQNKKFWKKVLNIGIVSLLVVYVAGYLISRAYNTYLFIHATRDDVKDNITIDEAQELLPFHICIPNELPSGITMRMAFQLLLMLRSTFTGCVKVNQK